MTTALPADGTRTVRTLLLTLDLAILLAAGRTSQAATNPPPSAVRTWTSLAGQTAQASFLRAAAGMVYLKKPDGQPIQIRLRELSLADQAMVADWTKPAAAPLPTPRTVPRVNKVPEGTYKGTYTWSGKNGTLTCDLTPDGDKVRAAFRCEYDGKTHAYDGFLTPDGGKDLWTGIFSVKQKDDYRLKANMASGRINADFLVRQKDGREQKDGDFRATKGAK